MIYFLIENVYLFPEVTVGVVKWIFCYEEGILMETDPFPAYLCRTLNILETDPFPAYLCRTLNILL